MFHRALSCATAKISSTLSNSVSASKDPSMNQVPTEGYVSVRSPPIQYVPYDIEGGFSRLLVDRPLRHDWYDLGVYAIQVALHHFIEEPCTTSIHLRRDHECRIQSGTQSNWQLCSCERGETCPGYATSVFQGNSLISVPWFCPKIHHSVGVLELFNAHLSGFWYSFTLILLAILSATVPLLLGFFPDFFFHTLCELRGL